jgi:hypothetical protein
MMATLAALGCRDSPTEPKGEPIGFQSLYASQYSGMETRRGEIIRDAGRWSAAWAEVHRGTSPQPPLPAVDLHSEMVILAAAGPRADSCWDLAIDSVRSGSAGIAVSAEEIRRTGCACLAVIVQPVHVVRAPRIEGPGFFDFDQRSVSVCP